jgi:hypothetical protein
VPLLLRCALCSRTQADGLLSRGYWGFVLLSDGRTAQACPACKSEAEWEERVRAVSDGDRVGGVIDPDPYA